MTFKLKAWQVYLIGVGIVPILLTILPPVIHSQPVLFDEIYFYMLGNTALYGGIALGIYYAIFQRFKKKEQGTK